MNAEAVNPASPGPVPPTATGAVTPAPRRKARPRIDLRRLGRAALLGSATRSRGLPDAIGHVVEAHRAHHPDADLDPLRRAYVLAESSHRGQMRKSGEPYITHPLAVTLILAELGAETTTLTASLLHDTVEDTEVTLDQVGEQFGAEVRYLVDGVTKLEKVDYGAAAEPETFRKMLLATGNDVRVMSIKLADRLHNMRTLGVMRREKQERIAKVTRDVLIPLAERLGVQALKSELEDLVFAVMHPEEYAHTRELVQENAARADDPLAAVADEVRGVLREADIQAEVLIRPRHFVSVHRVSRKRGTLRGADFGRLLVLVQEDADCYAVLGELHTCMTPVVSEFKDFIAVPKFNLYQSLHTAVARAEDGQVVEVLIRTHQMHKVAEAGVVALGNPYASGGGAERGRRRARRPHPARLALPAARLAARRPRPRHVLVHPPRGPRPGPRDHRLPPRRRHPRPPRRRDLCRRRLRPVRRGRPRDHRRPGQRAVGAHEHGAAGRRHRAAPDGPGPRLRALQGVAGARPHPGRADRHPAPARRPPGSGARGSGAAPRTRRTRAPRPPGRAATGPGRRTRPPRRRRRPRRPTGRDRTAGRLLHPVPPDEITGFAVRGGVVTVHRVQCAVVARMKSTGRAEVGVRWGRAPDAG